MSTQIFVNLPVKDLPRTVAFYEALGFQFNPAFSDDKGTCMVISETIFVMFLTEPFFQEFTNKPVADATKATEVLIALSVESREAVDELTAKAIAAGGTAPMPTRDHGWMYQHGFTDLDGHMWETAYMDPAGPGAEAFGPQS